MPLLKKILSTIFTYLIISNVYAEELTISAAISLSNAFKEIAQCYEAKHPDTKIHFNFAGSGTLLQQIAKGAPVDVFASADQTTMDKAQQQQLINTTERYDFVNNTLVIITPLTSNTSLNKLTDLKQITIERIAIGNPDSVPAGSYAKLALQQTNQWNSLQSKFIYTQNVRQALDYVARAEVDAGFVYGSDAAIMTNKVQVNLTIPINDKITYPIAIIKQSSHQVLAKSFIAFVLSEEGQGILVKYGFQKR